MSTRRIPKRQKRCGPHFGNFATFGAIVKAYKNGVKKNAQDELRFYASRRSFRDAVELASRAITKEGYKHDHQWRISNHALFSFSKALLLQKGRLGKAKNFHNLWLIVREAGSPIKGIGELTIYDTAHRIGAYLDLEPKVVYLHAGTRAGARALGMKAAGPSLDMSKLPVAFRRLKPYQVEDCLCIYKTAIDEIQRNRRSK